jgi:phage terminase large subunit-like protein
MKWIEALVEDGRLHHDGDPVLTWAVSNVTAREFADGTVMPRKERPESKIDPLVALVIAMATAMEAEEPVRSPWEDPTYSMAMV